jgi:hypothetical protein
MAKKGTKKATTASESSAGSASVVKLGTKQCKPFLLQVMVFSPEDGYKFEVVVERSCTAANDPIWKLVFDLYKKNKQDGFDQIVHVSFRAGSPDEETGVKQIVAAGVSSRQADLLVGPVYDAAKDLEGVDVPTSQQRERIRGQMSKVAVAEV